MGYRTQAEADRAATGGTMRSLPQQDPALAVSRLRTKAMSMQNNLQQTKAEVQVPEFRIEQRRGSHGHFAVQGAMAQALKNTMRTGYNWGRMHPAMQEGLDMIQHKISRILSGDPNFEDHWEDLRVMPAVLRRVIRNQDAAGYVQSVEPPAHHIPLQEPGSFMIGPGNQGLAEFDPT